MARTPSDETRKVAPGWSYCRLELWPAIELCVVRGQSVALPPHFHDEDQITFVLSGQRRFRMRDEIVTVEAGQGTLIRAGVVHSSLDEPSGVEGLNLYLPPGLRDAAEIRNDLCGLRNGKARIDPNALMAILRTYRLQKTEETTRTGPRRSVAERAASVGLTREGFSRAFMRKHGMPPHAFGLVARLNQARDRLRHGAPLVDVALEGGFADQSHLGRCFRRAFGVTPGRYRHGHDDRERSQTFQT